MYLFRTTPVSPPPPPQPVNPNQPRPMQSGMCNVQALASNFSVKNLDLSHNMIGDKETYNFVRPDYTTGGEAVADMLEVLSVFIFLALV